VTYTHQAVHFFRFYHAPFRDFHVLIQCPFSSPANASSTLIAFYNRNLIRF